MAKIVFRNICSLDQQRLVTLAEEISRQKALGQFDSEIICKLLGDKHELGFWWPTLEELICWQKRWSAASIDARNSDPALKNPWDYDSWIDALEHAEISITSIGIESNGCGILAFEQLAYPSGGIEALEYLIHLYDGEVVSNDAL